mmetsp:Transcript_14419/g.20136  ORF Transcript_14419/g.20136 Transcript_14419/m.20136 type:complete len:138 (+) Transcript_14419:99-512(+)
MGRKRWTACKEETSVSPLVKTKKQVVQAINHLDKIKKATSAPCEKVLFSFFLISEEEGVKASKGGDEYPETSLKTNGSICVASNSQLSRERGGRRQESKDDWLGQQNWLGSDHRRCSNRRHDIGAKVLSESRVGNIL